MLFIAKAEMMRSCVFRTIFFLSLLYLRAVAAWKRYVFVSPSGNDSPSCGNQAQPCKSLDTAFAIVLTGTGGANSTQVSVAKGNYTLSKSFNFINVDTFSLVGNSSRSAEVRITCAPNVSLSFVFCQNVSLEGFMLQKCGGWHESTVGLNKSAHAGQRHQGVKFKTALDFRYCRNAQFMNIEISSSPGLGVNLFNVGGVVNFTDCVLAENKALSRNKSSSGSLGRFIEEGFVYSGGGIYMILNQYGDNVVNITPGEHDSFQHNNTYVFTNCHFLRNEAVGWNISHKHDIIDDFGSSQFSLGGGLALNFRGNASYCDTKIESCEFVGNCAIWGGGLQIETRDEVRNNRFEIKNTSFHDNTGILAGGGVRIGNLRQGGADDPLNTFTFDDNCSFVNNSAIWGGGMSLYGTSVLCKVNCNEHKNRFIFNRCTWLDNKGTVGAALAAMLTNQNDVQTGPEMPYSISFKDCTFSSNQVVKKDEGVIIGEGALYSDQVPLIFQGRTLFEENTNTALSLDGSTIEIFNEVKFISNKGYRGGAVAMRGLSKIIFQKNSKLLFYGNSCNHKGGALYIEAAGSPLVDFNATGVDTHECFFGYTDSKADFKDWKTSVIFQGNMAVDDGKGNSVYATTLRNCRRPGESRQHNKVLLWHFVQFKTINGNVTSRESQVATDAIDIIYEPTDWEVAPSEVFNATVKLFDELENLVTGIVDVDIHFPIKSRPVKLDTTSSLFLTNGNISYLRLTGEPNSLFTVTLRYVGRQMLVDKINETKLQHCNAGFKFVPDDLTCVCNNSTEDGIAWCEPDGKTIYIKQGYWAGMVNGTFFTSPCPSEYCNFTRHLFPEVYQYVSGDEVCKAGRNQTSVLCGECKQGYSVLIGNEDCSSSCNNWWLLLNIAYFIALFIVSCFVLLINPNLASGHLNVCLYSYQILKILTPEGFKYDPVIEFLAALSNLQIQLGRGICFAADFNNADKLIVMAIYPFVEVVVLKILAMLNPIWRRALQRLYNRLQQDECSPGSCRNAFSTWLNNCWEAFNERVQNGFGYAYCTIAVLCYVDITHISLQLLHPVKVGGKMVLFADGDMEFFVSSWHIAYGSIAIVLMVFVIGFPILLVFYTGPNPHLHALRAYYKPGRRSRIFVAYYLGCRVVLLGISTYMPAGPLKSALLQFVCVLFLFIIAVARPYQEEANQGVLLQVGNQAEEDQQVANQGGNEPEEPERVAADAQQEVNGGPRGNGAQRVPGGENVENQWINESDVTVLTALCAIAVLSSPIGGNVSKSTGYGLMVFVRILAYVPLVMAFLPYAIRFVAWLQRRLNHVPERQAEVVPSEPAAQRIERAPPHGGNGAPNEQAVEWHERTPLLHEPDPQLNPHIPLAEVSNYESTFYTAPEQFGVDDDRYSTALESVVA